MSKFTPGPWHISAGTYSQRWVVDSKSPPTGKQNLIAMLQSHWKGNENDTMGANARLIAAAPAMYEALKACAEFIHHYDQEHNIGDGKVLEQAIAALRAAERGE